MGNISITSLLVATGVCLYAAMNHAFIAFGTKFSRLQFLFAIFCFFMAGFELTHGLTYTADTLAEYIPRLRWEVSFVILIFMVYPWFISEYSGIRPRWLLRGLAVLTTVLLIINVFQPYTLQFAEITRLEHVQYPWGESITRPIGRNGAIYYIGVAGVLVAFFFGIYALGVRYYRNRMGTTLVMLLAIGVFMLTGIEGMLVRMSVIDFIHLGPYGILALIIAMGLALNQEMRQKLRTSEQRFRSLVEQSPFSMQVLSPDGRTLQVNHAWEKLWDVTLEQIAGYNLLQDQQLHAKGVIPYLEKGFAGQPTEIPPINYNPAENSEYTGPRNERWVRAFVYPIMGENRTVQEVVLLHEDVTERKRFDDALRLIAASVSSETGNDFFEQLVLSLAKFFGTRYAFLGVLDAEDSKKINTVAVCESGKSVKNISYALKDTPCDEVVGKHTCVFAEDVQTLFPNDPLLVDMKAEAYVGTPLFDSNGNALGIIVLLHDEPLRDVEQMKAIMEIFAVRAAAEIERNKAEDLLRQHHDRLKEMVDQRTAELTAAIEELEAFSYSVSHDLRAPLRSIDGFSQALVEDYNKMLDDQGKDYLSRIRTNAQRMAQLIDDLLQLSRVTRKDINMQRVDISALVCSSISKHQEEEPARHVKSDVMDDVIASGDPDLVAVVIDNLISNAWKYTGKIEDAKIEFGLTEKNGVLTCYVRDNGVGFDMKYADKIFGPFQRLHSADEFEGTGIGLATVARIIHRHNGKVWAESQRNNGAVIYFSLPELNRSSMFH